MAEAKCITFAVVGPAKFNRPFRDELKTCDVTGDWIRTQKQLEYYSKESKKIVTEYKWPYVDSKSKFKEFIGDKWRDLLVYVLYFNGLGNKIFFE